MSNRTLKCFWCDQKDKEDKVEVVNGTQKKRYHKFRCYDLYLQDQEFKKKEKEELDELVEVIKSVHGIETIPNQFYSYLQDIRNGNELFGRIGHKKSKQGYAYKTIARTYEECIDSINWARNNRDFKGTLAFLKYTKAIISDKIDGVDYRLKQEELQKQQQTKIDQTYDYGFDSIQHTNKNDKQETDDMDISKFL